MFVSGAIPLPFAIFGQGYGPIFLDNVACTGDEFNLAKCSHPGIARAPNCIHNEDAGVICPLPGTMQHNTSYM